MAWFTTDWFSSHHTVRCAHKSGDVINFIIVACRISSRSKWYNNYKNRLRLAKVIVKNKMSRFLWFTVYRGEPLESPSGVRGQNPRREEWGEAPRSRRQMCKWILQEHTKNTKQTNSVREYFRVILNQHEMPVSYCQSSGQWKNYLWRRGVMHPSLPPATSQRVTGVPYIAKPSWQHKKTNVMTDWARFNVPPNTL